MFYKFYRFVAGICCLSIGAVLGLALYLSQSLPDHFYVAQGEGLVIQSDFNIQSMTAGQDAKARTVSQTGGSYRTSLKLFGTVAIKEVDVQVVERELVVPGGIPFGIKMFTDGVVVVGLSDVEVDGKFLNPSKQAGIRVGDVILEMNGEKVGLNEDVASIVAKSGGSPIAFKIRRGETTMGVLLTPVKGEDGSFRAGIWVRDSSAGIGTMTYYNPKTMVFAGLGHAICDVDTGEVMPLAKGEIVDVNITGVGKGHSGAPGELKGVFKNEQAMGYLMINGETGVFGRLKFPACDGFPIPLALRQEVQTGPAQIYTTLSGNKPQKYDILIEKVNINDQNTTKNMVIRVTDPVLLEKTGGIVQGMSGSPIIQNGRLVGAVTHVFVNDLSRGYGIFAENMNKTAQNVEGMNQIAS